MRRRERIGLVVAALAAGGVVITLLTSIGPASEGPIAGALTRLGAMLGSAETDLRRRLSGGGRADTLAWMAPYRADAARLLRPDRFFLGAYDSRVPETFEGIVELERGLGRTLPLIHIYAAWGDKPDQQFPIRLTSAIWNLGSIPMVTWEPWLTDFENALHPSLPLRNDRDRHGLAAVARGEYDFYIDAWAASAAAFGHPIFVRLGHEMNDPYRYPWGPQNNTKEEFIAAWRRVVDRFRQAGARNVLWVWSPHVAYTYWDLYYPGGDYVDWVSTGALNFGTVAHWSRWWSFQELFGNKYRVLAAFNKPVMIDEIGSLAVGGDRKTWFRDALTQLPTRFPAVKALLFFHARSDQTLTYQQVSWSILDDAELTSEIRTALSGWIE